MLNESLVVFSKLAFCNLLDATVLHVQSGVEENIDRPHTSDKNTRIIVAQARSEDLVNREIYRGVENRLVETHGRLYDLTMQLVITYQVVKSPCTAQ